MSKLIFISVYTNLNNARSFQWVFCLLEKSRVFIYFFSQSTDISCIWGSFIAQYSSENIKMTLQLIHNLLKFTWIPKTLFSEFSIVTLIKNIQNFRNTSRICIFIAKFLGLLGLLEVFNYIQAFSFLASSLMQPGSVK